MEEGYVQNLRKEITELKDKIKDQDQIIFSYQNNQNTAETKIQGLNNLHAQKIRSLMKSIQELKKENASLKYQSKDHKRSELIERLQKDIQEGRLPKNEQDIADKEIIKQMSKGPPRHRILSREEMKIEIDTQRKKILSLEQKLKSKKDGNNGSNGNSLAGSIKSQQKSQEIEMDEEINQVDFTNFQENQINEMDEKDKQIAEQLEQIEQLINQNKALELIKDKQAHEFEELHNQFRKLEIYKVQSKEWMSEKLALEDEIERLRQEMQNKFMQNQTTNVEQQEILLENKLLHEKIYNLQNSKNNEKQN